MNRQHISASVIIATVFVISVVLGAQSQRATPTAANGIAMSEFNGYEAWQVIATSEAGDDGCGTNNVGCTKAILGNPIMIRAYRDGFPANGKPAPDGARIAKIEWLKELNPSAPYAVTVPGRNTGIAFMVKDSRRFPGTDGWGYATFEPDTNGLFKPYAAHKDPAFATACHQCHTTGAKTTGFVYTAFAKR